MQSHDQSSTKRAIRGTAINEKQLSVFKFIEQHNPLLENTSPIMDIEMCDNETCMYECPLNQSDEGLLLLLMMAAIEPIGPNIRASVQRNGLVEVTKLE